MSSIARINYREGIIDNALHLALWCGLFLSDSAYQSQVRGWNGSECACMGMRVCVCVCVCIRVTMLMRTIIFLHLESISCDYDDGLSYPYYYQD